MFTSNALPPLSTFGHEHHPLRLTSDARPQPQGGCHFQAGQRQRCLCQTYQHNRSAPGNICDCGHSACYHSQHSHEGRLSPDRVVSALVEKVKKLEDLFIKERESRNGQIARERQVWEREARVLREALAPFYQTEADLKRRLVELESKVDTSYDEQHRLKQKVVAIDDVSMTLEKRLEECEFIRCRKRKSSPSHEENLNGIMSPESNYTWSGSSVSDATSIITHRSPQPSSPPNLPMPISIGTTSPRSSGVLLLSCAANHNEGHHLYTAQHHRQQPSSNHEPRSSGFLSIDLAERLRNHNTEPLHRGEPPLASISRDQISPASTNRTHPRSPPHQKAVSGILPVSASPPNNIRPDLESRMHKKLKHNSSGMTGLELLANAASPLAQHS